MADTPPQGKSFIIVITAPSGAGKTTVIHSLLARNPRLKYSISSTTRPRREGETDGSDYFFMNEKLFRRKIAENQFAEWAEVHGHLYGTLRSQVEEPLQDGFHVLMDVDVQGAQKLREKYADGVYIYLMPPSMGELKRRLIDRQTETVDSLRLRLENSVAELEAIRDFGYMVVNDKLDDTIRDISGIIRAEELRVSRLGKPSSLVKSFLGNQGDQQGDDL